MNVEKQDLVKVNENDGGKMGIENGMVYILIISTWL